jgi:predicted ATP-binding protein involved in virulence
MQDPGGALNRTLMEIPGSSLFFPTFRRIEGGFSMGARVHAPDAAYYPFDEIELGKDLNRLSERLTVRNHKFISSISTDDIVVAITKQYANISERTNQEHRALSQEIIKNIRQYEAGSGGKTNAAEQLLKATEILEQIQQQVSDHSKAQESLLAPFSELSKLVNRIFQDKKIQLTERIALGEARESIVSNVLSAGEKQMLSFLAYNAFATGSIIFIDEPEISLHVDWQRILFPTLLSQGPRNQFVVATHSPFIYSRYADKELLLDSDRGDAHSDEQGT